MSPDSVVQIDDPDDLRLELYADIRHRAAMPESRYFIAEGRLVVGRLIDSDYELHSLLVERGRESEFAAMLPPEVPIYSVPKTHIRELVGFDFHRGVIGCGYRKPIRSFSEFISGSATFVSDSAGSSDRATVALAAICVTEPANLGGMLRTAAAFGIDQVLLSPSTHDPLARRVIRTSMAATFKHNFYRLDDPTNQLPTLAEQYNCRTIATTLAADATPIGSFNTNDQKLVLLMGSEARGLDPEIERAATDRVTIPMRLGVDSLNVSTAAAIFMYELTRSRPPAEPRGGMTGSAADV